MPQPILLTFFLGKDKKCILFTIFLVQHLTTSDNPISLWFFVNMEFKFWLEVENSKYYRKSDKIQASKGMRWLNADFSTFLVPFNEHVQRSTLQFIKQKYKNKLQEYQWPIFVFAWIRKWHWRNSHHEREITHLCTFIKEKLSLSPMYTNYKKYKKQSNFFCLMKHSRLSQFAVVFS